MVRDVIKAFAAVQPMTLEMLDAKTRIFDAWRAISPTILADTDAAVQAMFKSQALIIESKSRMGRFSTREQNSELKTLRKIHTESFKIVDQFLAWSKR